MFFRGIFGDWARTERPFALTFVCIAGLTSLGLAAIANIATVIGLVVLGAEVQSIGDAVPMRAAGIAARLVLGLFPFWAFAEALLLKRRARVALLAYAWIALIGCTVFITLVATMRGMQGGAGLVVSNLGTVMTEVLPVPLALMFILRRADVRAAFERRPLPHIRAGAANAVAGTPEG